MHYVNGKKPDLKGYMLYNSIHMSFWKRQNYRDKWAYGLTQMSVLEDCIGGKELFVILIMVVIT